MKWFYIIFIISYCYGIDYYHTSQSPYLNLLKWTSPSYFNRIGPLTNSIEFQSIRLPSLHSIDEDMHYQLFSNLNFNNSEAPYQQVSGLVLLEFSESIYFQNNFTFSSQGSNNKHFKGVEKKSLDGWFGYLNSSLVNYRYNNGHLLMGKTNIFLNSFSENLLLNGGFPPNPAIWWHHNSKKWEYDWSLQLLDEVDSYGRLFTFHRYTVLGDTYSFSFSEFALIRYIDFFKDALKYTLPSVVIAETEINDGGNNLFWFIDGYSQLGDFTLFGEFLIDDYALDKKSPHKFAFKIGSRFSTRKNKIQLEYLRINRWVGNYFHPELQMQENTVLIGHLLGPDSHKLSLEFYSEYSKNIILSMALYIIEKGEGNIDEPWPVEGASRNFGYSYEEFPSGMKELYHGFILNPYLLIGESLIFESIIDYQANTAKIDFQMKINLIY